MSSSTRETPLQAIVWDVDGVIAETEDLHRRAYNALFKELGIDREWSKEDHFRLMPVPSRKKVAEIASWIGPKAVASDEYQTEIYSRKVQLLNDLFTATIESGEIAARPGVIRLVEEALARNLHLAAASSSISDSVHHILRLSLGEASYSRFGAICASNHVRTLKPSPEIYLLAAEKIGVSPGQCVAIEDTCHGLQAAKTAGMACIVTPSEYTRDQDFRDADLVVADLDNGSGKHIDVQTLRSLVQRVG
jgi:beta-phosphoglucomutase-like phosphatase (HAD superfamily)